MESGVDFLSADFTTGRTGHSERSTVTSILAAVGFTKEDRAYLGRWASSSSEEYVRTCKAVVRRLVGSFVKEGTSEGAYEALDAEAKFEKYKNSAPKGRNPRDTETQRHRDTDTDTDAHTHTHRHTQTHTDRHTQTHTHTDTETQTHTHRHTHTDTHTHTQAHRHTEQFCS